MQTRAGTLDRVVQRVLEAMLSLLSPRSRRSDRTLHGPRTTHAIRMDLDRLLGAFFLLVFAAGVILAAVQAARLSLLVAFGG